MSNPFKNAAAGIFDGIFSFADLAALPFGLYSGIKNKVDGGSFGEGYIQNPFVQGASSIHRGIGNVLGADDESIIREISSFAAPSAAVAKLSNMASISRNARKAVKFAEKGNLEEATRYSNKVQQLKQNRLTPGDVAAGFGTAAIGNAAFNYILDSDSETNGFWNAVAGLTLSKRGLRKLKGIQTKTDKSNIPSNINEVDDNLGRAEWRKNWDARGGVIDKMETTKLVTPEEAVSLSFSPEDLVNKSSFMQNEFKNAIESIKKTQLQDDVFEKNNLFGAVNAIMGARVGAFRDFLKNASDEQLGIVGLVNREGANALLKAMSEGNLDYQFGYASNFLDNAKIFKGMDGISNDKLYKMYTTLSKELGREHFLTPELKDLMKRVNGIAYNKGLISAKEMKEYNDDITSGIYVPLKSDEERNLNEIYRSINPYKNKRRGLADDKIKLRQGVDDPGNSYNVLFNKIYSELLAAERNGMINRIMPVLVKRHDGVIEELKKNKGANVSKFVDDYYAIKTYSQDDLEKMAYKNKTSVEEELAKLMYDYEKKGMIRIIHYSEGQQLNTFAPKDFKYIFEQRPVNSSFYNKFLVRTNRIWTSTKTGKWNPFFLPKRVWYGDNEVVPAIQTELKKLGINASPLEIRKIYFSELLSSYKVGFIRMLDEAVSDNVFLGKKAKGSVEKFRRQIDKILSEDERVWNKIREYNVIRNDVMGDALRNSNGTIDISIYGGVSSELAQKALSAYRWIDTSTLGRIFQFFKSGADNAVPRTISKVMDTYGIQNGLYDNGKITNRGSMFVRNISRKLADTRRRGTGETKVSKAFNLIQDYVPYGAVSLQGIMGKAEYLPKNATKRIKDYVERARKANDNVFDTGIDILAKFGQQLARLPGNAVFDVLWKTIALQAMICYIWNYGNEENARYYNSLKPWERSNKFQLVNFFGEGINLSIPIDQEWSIIKNIFDASLERMFGLSDAYDRGNPAFSMRDQLVWSLGQDFGINLPVAGEAALNLMGLRSNIDAAAVLNAELPIQEINEYKYHTIPDGLAEAMISLTGNIGKMIVNLVEDRPVMDFRYAIPFLQIYPKQKPTSDTVSFLNNELKTNPTPELQEWYNKRKYLLQAKSFYERYGTTKNGTTLGPRKEVSAMYQKQIDDLNRKTYETVADKNRLSE